MPCGMVAIHASEAVLDAASFHEDSNTLNSNDGIMINIKYEPELLLNTATRIYTEYKDQFILAARKTY